MATKNIELNRQVEEHLKGRGRIAVAFPDPGIPMPGCEEEGAPPCYMPVLIRVSFTWAVSLTE